MSRRISPYTIPSELELEQEIVGCLIRNNLLYESVEHLIKPEYFETTVYRELYAAIEKLLSRGQVATPLSLSGLVDIPNEKPLEFLIGITTNVISATHAAIKSHAEKLQDVYIRRSLLSIADQLSQNVVGGREEAMSYLENAEMSLFELGTYQQHKEPMSLSDAAHKALENSRAARASGRKVIGVPTGLADLDAQLGGMQNSDLIVIAARPAMGKTALGLCIARNAAKNGYPAAFFSLEMSFDQLGNRALSEAARVPSDKLRVGAYDERDLAALIRSVQDINQPVYIDDTAGMTIEGLRVRIRRMIRKYNIKFVVVDHIQLLAANKRSENRVQELSTITRVLKCIAKELRIPILALSQLSRAVEQREDKRPQLSDLRESGTIEQDADVVMFIYRAAYYLSGRKPEEGSDKLAEWQEQMARCHNEAEIIISKQRHGPVGTVKLNYDPRWTLFSDIDYKAG